MTMTLGSLFDGIGGWQLAAQHAGVEPIWSSEIEPFPCAVTAKHFPKTVQIGDITKLDGEKLWPVDIICAGSPCQDLSVAGKQEGLKGERSGLFRDAIRLVRDMRRASGGKYPRFFVWENVPGAFSSNGGMDFLAVLEEIGEAKLPIPQNGKWANAGMVELPRCEIAWRVLDAQYWGVPQRRKRIFLVADFAESGRCAAKILFEREGVRGDNSTGGATGEGTSAGIENRVGNTIVRLRAGKPGGGKGALISKEKSLSLKSDNDQVLFCEKTASTVRADAGAPKHMSDILGRCVVDKCLTPWDYQEKRISSVDGVAPTLNGSDGGGGRTCAGYVFIPDKARSLTARADGSPCVDRGPDVVAVYDIQHRDEPPRLQQGKSCCLTARIGQGGLNVPIACYSIAGNTMDRKDENGGNGSGFMAEKSYTLNTMDRHAVASFSESSFGTFREDGKSGTLKESGVCIGGGSETMICGKAVRRLTPIECERLQGLPDNYTLIDDKTCSDSARYRALGNGMAQPCADYVIRRIVEESA